MDKKKEIGYKLGKLERLLYYIDGMPHVLSGILGLQNEIFSDDSLLARADICYVKIEKIFEQSNITDTDEKILLEQLHKMMLCFSEWNTTPKETYALIDILTDEQLNELELQIDRYLTVRAFYPKYRKWKN